MIDTTTAHAVFDLDGSPGVAITFPDGTAELRTGQGIRTARFAVVVEYGPDTIQRRERGRLFGVLSTHATEAGAHQRRNRFGRYYLSSAILPIAQADHTNGGPQ